MIEAQTTGEALHPDLRAHVRTETIGDQRVQMIRHPLVVYLPYAPSINATVNRLYESKQAAVKDATEREDWYRLVHMHERWYRLEAFLSIPAERISDRDYWQLLSEIWSDSENIHEYLDHWRRLLSSDRPGRHLMMSDHDRQRLEAMAEELTVYRGYAHPQAADGMSWTLDEERARWFAARFDPDQAWLARAVIGRGRVIAFLDGRGEEEIILNPRDLHDRTDQQIS